MLLFTNILYYIISALFCTYDINKNYAERLRSVKECYLTLFIINVIVVKFILFKLKESNEF